LIRIKPEINPLLLRVALPCLVVAGAIGCGSKGNDDTALRRPAEAHRRAAPRRRRYDAAMEIRSRLVRHGLLLFLLGLITGFVVPSMVNPRAGLASHLEGVMNGMFLVIVGLAWSELKLSSRAGRAVSWLLLFGTWANWGATTAAAVLGTSKGTPIAGAGFHAGALAENGVYGLLVLVGLTMTVSCTGLVVGAWRAR
jgi:hydroxylaminobenzene mutase